MLNKMKEFFNSLLEEEQTNTTADHNLAITALLCEVCNADHDMSDVEQTVITKTLSKLLNVDTKQAQALLEMGKQKISESNSLFDFTTQLRALDFSTRSQLVTAMWEVAYADNYLDPIEEHVIRKVSDLIYVNHSEFIRTKLAVVDTLPDGVSTAC
ncbi:TerB family tellurite resistance protein [Psychromonas sp. PT13]|uniref:tellurite resistance TerB family protein n=1 Tax=Psychromonas sp. PT13 TaxID=3439547 RepID=UPI003EBB452B